MAKTPVQTDWPLHGPCPCGGDPLARCCAVILDDSQPAVTAEALMRSRYTAFVLGDTEYLLRSWHPRTRPEHIHLGSLRQRWLGLAIKHCEAGSAADIEGVVEFVARSKVDGKAERLHERSRFLKVAGRWYYVDGDLLQ